MIVRTFRIAGNQRYSWIEPAIKVREPNATTQLMSQRRILGFKPQLRPEWRGQDA
jgi:hypothetical protein